jgi:DNA-binding Xre family transcriptional regulator
VKSVDDLFTHQDNEMLADVRDYDAAMERIAAGEELVPAEVVYALLDGGNPIRVWREYRGLSQGELAAKAGISASYLSQLETGKRDGTMDVLQGIAAALDVGLEDLLGRSGDDSPPPRHTYPEGKRSRPGRRAVDRE